MRTPEYLAGYKAALEDITARANKIMDMDRAGVIKLLLHTETVNQAVTDAQFVVSEGSDQLSISGLFLDGRNESPNPYGIVFVTESGSGTAREDWIPKVEYLGVTEIPYPEESA